MFLWGLALAPELLCYSCDVACRVPGQVRDSALVRGWRPGGLGHEDRDQGRVLQGVGCREGGLSDVSGGSDQVPSRSVLGYSLVPRVQAHLLDVVVFRISYLLQEVFVGGALLCGKESGDVFEYEVEGPVFSYVAYDMLKY